MRTNRGFRRRFCSRCGTRKLVTIIFRNHDELDCINQQTKDAPSGVPPRKKLGSIQSRTRSSVWPVCTPVSVING